MKGRAGLVQAIFCSLFATTTLEVLEPRELLKVRSESESTWFTRQAPNESDLFSYQVV